MLHDLPRVNHGDAFDYRLFICSSEREGLMCVCYGSQSYFSLVNNRNVRHRDVRECEPPSAHEGDDRN